MEAAKAEYLRQLERRGLKRTAQRERVVDLFLSTEGHLSAEEFYHLVRQHCQNIGYSTVYRTLRLLVEMGLADPVQLGGEITRFEHKFEHEHHDHLVCTRCGRSVEFRSPELEALQEKVARQHGFSPQEHRLEIRGLCSDCAAK